MTASGGLFPSLSADEVLAATRQRWNIDGPSPLPVGGWLVCPVCRSGSPQPRWWKWHQRPSGHTIPWRCDVSFKCTSCAALWVHGVVLDREAWERRPWPKQDRKTVGWRKVAALL